MLSCGGFMFAAGCLPHLFRGIGIQGRNRQTDNKVRPW